MSKPLFSVVTVTLNCADVAEMTAKSVLAQSYGAVEYIVKDGCSTDGTVERVRALGVDVHVSKDRGIYDAMNQALDLCSGEYVYFLNAGDVFHTPDALERIAAKLDRKAAIVYCDLMLMPMRYHKRHPRNLSRYYLFRKNMNHQAWLARRDHYQRLGKFDTSYRWNADQDIFWKTVFRHKQPVQYVDEIIAQFMYGGASTSRAASGKVADERWRLVKQFFEPWEIAIYGTAGLYWLNPLKRRIWWAIHRTA